MEGILKYRYNNLEINSLEAYASIRGKAHNSSKDVYFVRMLGWREGFGQEILRMDTRLKNEMQEGKLFYRRVDRLPKLSKTEDIAYYTACYDQWTAQPKDGIRTKVSGSKEGCVDGKLACQLGVACQETMKKYQDGKTAMTGSIRKNFAVKLLYWFDAVCSGLEQWNALSCIKIVAGNVVKEQEYLFYYFLTLVGCDVLLLQNAEDLADDKKKRLSVEIRIGDFGQGEIPEAAAADGAAEEEPERVVVKIPQRSRQKKVRQEKSFEELAALASSVVLIEVHGQDGEIVSTGSGIMVAREGYILTNHHVVRGGYSYSIRIENDDQVYHTDELIKYHTMLDLALLRIGRRLDPIPIYQGPERLVRGQAVAAIGSPLGLFNSISDGIISGFRKINGINMIQFTAPISHGSSGGAVLNMYGEVIGISTAGFDQGQNINLAVGYESINLFVQGF